MSDSESGSTWSVWLDRLKFAALVLVVALALVAMEVLGLVILDLVR